MVQDEVFSVALLFSKSVKDDDLKEYESVLEEYDMTVTEIVQVPRETEPIKEALFDLFMRKFALVITFGGIGLEDDDIVPEATYSLVDKRFPGLENAIMYALMEKGTYSIVNRGVAGLFHDTIVINLPSKRFLVKQILYTILPLVKQGLKKISEKK